MNYAWERTTAPAGTPVLLEEMKDHMRVDHEDDDALIHALLYAATAYVEDATGRSLVTQTWKLTLDALPTCRCVRLPMPPLASVTSVKYTPAGDSEVTIGSSTYTVWTPAEQLCLNDGVTWPTATVNAGGVVIEFIAGAARETVSKLDKIMVKLLCAHWYENRETVVVGTISSELAFTMTTLINTNRSFWAKP